MRKLIKTQANTEDGKTVQEKWGKTLYREDAKNAKKIKGLGVENITPFAIFASLRFDCYYFFRQ